MWDDDEWNDDPLQDASKEVIDNAVEEAKAAAKSAAKEAAKEAGKKIVQLLAKFVVEFWWLILIIIGVIVAVFVALMIYQRADDIKNAVNDYWNSVAMHMQGGQYDPKEVKAWDTSGDLDHTAIVAQWLQDSLDKAAKGEKDDGPFADIANHDEWMIAPEDMESLLTSAEQYNKKKFEQNDIFYSFVEKIYQRDITYYDGGRTSESGTLSWHDIVDALAKYHTVHTTDSASSLTPDDGVYGKLQRLGVEGEKDNNGDYRFDVHWQDAMALAIMAGYSNFDNWGDTGDKTAYTGKDPYHSDNTTGYYLSKGELTAISNMFQYRFAYYYDAVDDRNHGMTNIYHYDDLHAGKAIGYRFDKTDDQVLSDTAAEGDEYHIRYTPEAAPDKISNSYDSYEYIYVASNTLQNYYPVGTTEADKPPAGQVCVGRWHLVNPDGLIEMMADHAPYWKEKAMDADFMKSEEGKHYDWAKEMMDYYTELLDILPYTDGADGRTARSEYYNQILNLYESKTILLSYEGTDYDRAAMDKYIDNIKSIYPGWNVTVSYPDAGSKYESAYYPVPQDISPENMEGIPFWSYGVTYGTEDVKEMKHAGTNPWGTNLTKVWVGARSGNATGHTEYMNVHDWFYISEDARANLYSSDISFSKDQTRAMLAYLEDKSGGSIPFTDATDSLYEWHKDTGGSISGALAIILTEGGYNSSYGRNYYNFYNYTATKGESVIPGHSHPWWNVKADYGDIGSCLVAQINKVYKNYWGKGQNSYFGMCWRISGGELYSAQDDDSAAEQDGTLTHCYCPWYEDTGYRQTGYNSYYSWANKCGRSKHTLEEAAGL